MRSAYIEIIEDCNLRCVFCSRGERKGIYPPEKVKELIDKYAREGYKKAILTGGEPILHPNLPDFIAYAREKGFQVAIQTNGVLMSKEIAKRLKKSGLDQAIFSIHSHIPIMEDRLMRGKDVLKKQIRGLLNAHKAGLFTPVTTLILRQNYRILPDFFRFMVDNYPFVSHFTLNFVDPIGRAWKNKWVVPKYSEVEPFLIKTLLILRKAKKTFRVERVPLCYMLEFAEHNTEMRRIITGEPSVVYREAESINYTNEYFANEYVRGRACSTCWLRGICPGVDKEYAQIYGTGEVYPIFVNPEIIIKEAGED